MFWVDMMNEIGQTENEYLRHWNWKHTAYAVSTQGHQRAKYRLTNVRMYCNKQCNNAVQVTLKMEAARPSKTLVSYCITTQHHNW